MDPSWSLLTRRIRRWLQGRVAGVERADLIIAAVFAACVLRLLLPYREFHFPSLRGPVGATADEGTVLFFADSLRRGLAVYREVWDFKGPVGYMPLALGLAFDLAHPIAAGRTAMLCLIAVWSGVTYLAIRRITGSRMIALLAALAPPFLCWPGWPFAYQDFGGQLYTTLAVLFALASATRPRLIVAAGACTALSFWTSLSQGPALLSLGGAIALVHFASEGWRSAWRVTLRYLLGAVAVTLPLMLWLAAHRSLFDALEAIFVFPFKGYSTPSNLTYYGQDQMSYVTTWGETGLWHGRAVHVMTSALLWIPKVAIVLSLLIAAFLLFLTIYRIVTGRPSLLASDRTKLLQLAIPAAAVAPALPVALSLSRSDIAHICFIFETSVLVLAVFVSRFWWGSQRAVRLVGTALQPLFALAIVFPAVVAATFHAYLLSRPLVSMDIDEWSRVAHGGLVVAARSRPDDRVLMRGPAGYKYLAAHRDPAVPYLVLCDYDYCADQLPLVARQIATERPRLLLVDAYYFSLLASYQPIIPTLYFGYSGNYMLKAIRPFPALCLDGTWSYRMEGSVATMQLRLEQQSDAPARFVATMGTVPLLAHADENRIAWFNDPDMWIATFAPDGRSMSGWLYRNQKPDRRFTAELVTCAKPAVTACSSGHRGCGQTSP